MVERTGAGFLVFERHVNRDLRDLIQWGSWITRMAGTFWFIGESIELR